MTTKTYATVDGLNRALRRLPKEVSGQLRDASQDISRDVASGAESKAKSVGGAAKLVTVKAGRDRVPVVKVTAPKGKPVVMGSEFGGGARKTTRQFRPHLGPTGYFLYPTVRSRHDEIIDRYSEALLRALRSI